MRGRKFAAQVSGHPVDDRLDWRDPEMPCIRDYVVEDDFGFVTERGVELVKPKEVSKVARVDLRETSNPTYHVDKSYDWGLEARRRKAKRLRSYGAA
jgi:hypothetical protein